MKRYFCSLWLVGLLLVPVFLSSQTVEGAGEDGKAPLVLVGLPEAYPPSNLNTAGWLGSEKEFQDPAVQRWQTGQPDPKSLAVPQELLRKLKSDPLGTLPALAAFLKEGSQNEFHTVKRLHDWITSFLAYDSDKFCGRAPGESAVADLLVSGKTTCGGYARLFKALCEEAGIAVQTVSGDSRGYFNGNELSDHAWNVVEIQGRKYVVDTTHDGRFSYSYGQFGPLEAYSDAWLFASPQRKLLYNRAYKLEEQFVERPLDLPEFLAQPHIGLANLRMGAVWDFSGLKGLFTKAGLPVADSSLAAVRDVWYPGRDRGFIDLQVPLGVSIKTRLKLESSQQEYPLSSGAEHQNSGDPGAAYQKIRIRVQPPAPGLYRLSVMATAQKDEPWTGYTTLYSLLVVQKEPPKSSYAYDPEVLYKGGAGEFYKTGSSVSASRALEALPLDSQWKRVDVNLQLGLESYAAHYDLLGNKLAETPAVSFRSVLEKTYYFRPLAQDTFVKIYLKNASESLFNHYLTTFFLPAAKKGQGKTPEFPQGEMILKASFHEAGLEVSRSLQREGNGWVLGVSGRELDRLRVTYQPQDGQKVPLGAYLERGGRDGEVFIKAVSGAAGARVLLYLRNERDTFNTQLTVDLPPEPRAPPPEKGRFVDHGLVPSTAFKAELLDPYGSAGALKVQLNQSSTLSTTLYYKDGSRPEDEVRKKVYTTSYPATGTTVWVFSQPPEAGMYFQIWSKADPSARGILLGTYFLPDPTFAADVSPGRFGLIPRASSFFQQQGLSLGGWAMKGNQYSLEFQGPKELSVRVRLKDSEGKTLSLLPNPQWEKGFWKVHIEFPLDLPPGTEAWISLIQPDKIWKTLLTVAP